MLEPLGAGLGRKDVQSLRASHPSFDKELGQSLPLVKKHASECSSWTLWLGMSGDNSAKRLLARAPGFLRVQHSECQQWLWFGGLGDRNRSASCCQKSVQTCQSDGEGTG